MKDRRLLIIFCSLVLACLTLSLFFVGGGSWGVGKIITAVVGTVWAFFVIPAVTLMMCRAHAGGHFIDSMAIMVAIFAAPILGVLYYVNYFRRG